MASVANTKYTELANPGSSQPVAELLCSYDLHGKLIEVSETFESVVGYSRQHLLNQPLSFLLEPDSWKTAEQNILEHVGGASPQPRHVRIRLKSGVSVSVELDTRLVFEKGIPVAVQAFGRDMAKLVSRESSIWRESHGTFAENLKQLHRLSTTNHSSLGHMFADYLRTGCEVFRLATGLVLRVEGKWGKICALSGHPDRLTLDARLPLEATHFGSVADRLRTHAHGQAAVDGRLEPDLQICIATPILVETELFGMLSFSSPGNQNRRVFSGEEREVIELMASGMARFILEDRVQTERALIELREKQLNRVLEMVAANRPLIDTLQQLTASVESHLPGTACAVLLLKQGFLSVECAPRLPDRFRELIAQECLQPQASSKVDPFAALFTKKRFPFLPTLGFELGPAATVISAAGFPLGAILLLQETGAAPALPSEEILRMACRMAGIAIEQRQLADRLAFQAQHDFLTGLPNRFHLLELLEARIADPEAELSGLAVLFIDLDRFKQINDTLGHPVGDRILIEVAERLRAALPSQSDFAARMGGDEFAVVLNGLRSASAALDAARPFLNALRLPYRIDGRELFVTPSIGVSRFPLHGNDAGTLLRRADSAMYTAKNDGKNAVECFVAESEQGGIERLELETALRRALEKSEFELYFQPIVAMDGALEGLEALLAWNHATRGRIPASQFIPLAEETGLIVPIGAWVLNEACRLGARWLEAGWAAKPIAVNMSALQFSRPNFVETVASALASNLYPPRLLELELTESLVLRDIGESIHRMTELRDLGVMMAIDDFGTGYSSLNYLSRLPVNSLKIDQSFLRALEAQPGTLTVIQSIVSLAHQMNLTVVAEGVETLEELELLRAAGCDRAQGHLFCASMRAAEVEKMLASPDRQVFMMKRAKSSSR